MITDSMIIDRSPIRSLAVILNPTAGRGAAGRALAKVRSYLAKNFQGDIAYHTTERRGDGQVLAGRAIAEGATIVAAMGGDGTLHEVTNALLESGGDAALGLIPFGTGNDFARAVGLRSSLESVLGVLSSGAPHPIDIGAIEGNGLDGKRHFLVAAGVGFVADTARTTNSGIRLLSGPAAYVYAAIKTLRGFSPMELTLSVDGAPATTRSAMLLSVSNVATTGGGIRIAPDAVPDDGLFDICLVDAMPKMRLLCKLPAAFTGTHISDRQVTMIKAHQLEISTNVPCSLWIDGEVMGTTPARFKILPGALRMMLPETACHGGSREHRPT